MYCIFATEKGKGMETINKNKSLYKVLLYLLKILPIVTAFGYFLNTLFGFLGIDSPVFSFFCGLSLLPFLFILIAAIVFRFCIFHKLFLYYIALSDTVNYIDYFHPIPYPEYNIIVILILILGFLLFLILVYHVKYT